LTDPASDELMKELGVDCPEEAVGNMLAAVGRKANNSRFFLPHDATQRFTPFPATERREETPQPTKFSVMVDGLLDYLNSREPSWWTEGKKKREQEITFVIDSLLELYDGYKAI